MAIRARLHPPVDAASLAVFRMLFGALMLVAVIRFFAHSWIADYYATPEHFFTYNGFSWVRPWPGIGMYLHFGAMGVLAICIALGLYYRASVALFGLLFAYAHLIDKTNYLNHYYLVICLCFVMTLLPLHATWSLDARRDPRVRSSTVPAWVLWVVRAQIALVYVFGGIAKLKADWLFDAQPMSIWLSANTEFPLIGSYFDERWVAFAFSYAGLLFDLTIVPLLLWRRSRPFAYVAVVVFHVTTMRLFNLGMFPWIMMACSLVFLPASWPRRTPVAPTPSEQPMLRAPRLAWLLGAYFAVQLVLPLRHLAYPGDVCWTEEGFRLSWNVMVMEKTGSVDFRVTEPATGKQWIVSPHDYLTRYQTKMMSTQPDMILELAHWIADDFTRRGIRDPEVRADAFASLNGRQRARLVDPTIDLARRTRGLAPYTWVLPMTESPTTRASRASQMTEASEAVRPSRARVEK